ncbi:MAG: ShlB/FhaC/HecB family hemolysin secretion/activation protein [Methylomonas lenta]|nr:ShlB/FhaC/HecB family hemolysin secretion/activation protein [Methylomonas lenta]
MQLNHTFWVKAYFVVACCGLVSLSEAWGQEAEVQAESATSQPVAPQQPASFDLMELRVKGNTMLDKKQLERTIYPFLGPKKSIDNVEAARSALEQLYKTQGYQTVAVDIPEQDVKNGVVYLQVVEGKISRLRVKGSRYFDQGKIKAAVPELAEGTVPNFPKMQKQLAELSSQSTDRQVVPVLRAGDTPGTLEVDLKVQDELPLHGRVELNGRNTYGTERLRLVNSLRYDNLWQRMHSASLMYQVAPENRQEVEVWAGTYAMPVFNTDAKLALYGVSSASNSQVASVGALAVIGIGNIYGARLIKPLTGFDNYFHSVTAGVDYKDFKEDLNLIGSDSIETPISYLPFLAQYSGTLRDQTSMTTFDVGVHFSVRGLGNDPQQFEDKRYLAQANYAYVSGNLKHEHDLPLDMQLLARFSGQVANSPLISNEQFSLGGAQSVRGYYETQALADNAVFGSLELQSPHLAPADWEYVNELKLLTFFDIGQGWIQDALPGNVNGNFLSGGGLGLRFKVFKQFSGLMDLGFPFASLGPVTSGDPRLHFSIAGEF